MKKSKLSFLILLSVLLSGCKSVTPKGDCVHVDANSDNICDNCGDRTGIVTLDIYGINDFHGAVNTNIGLAKMGTFIKSKTDEDNTLFIDSGDTWQGSAESNLNRGKLITDVFAYANLTSRTIGNHDFDWGMSNLEANYLREYEGHRIPTLGANIYDYNFDTKTEGNTHQNQICDEYLVKELPNGLRVGIVGVIGQNQITSIATEFVKNICFKDHIKTIKDISDKLRVEEKCDIVIASEHDGYSDEEKELTKISSVSGKRYVDFVFNGHTHYNEEFKYGGVTFAQCGANGDAIGHATLTYSYESETVSTKYNCYSTYEVKNLVSTIDPKIQSIIDSYAVDSDPIANEILHDDFRGTFDRYVTFPNLMCEAIYTECKKEGYNVDFVMCNETRKAFYANSGKEISYRDLFASFPFDNEVFIIKGKGNKWVNEICNYNCVYNNGFSEVNANTEYTVAALDYLAYHTNTRREYDYFPNATTIGYLQKSDGSLYTYRDILADYLKANPNKTFDSSDYDSDVARFMHPKDNAHFN